MQFAKGLAASLLSGVRPGSTTVRHSYILTRCSLNSCVVRPIHISTMRSFQPLQTLTGINNATRFPVCQRATPFLRYSNNGSPLNRRFSLLFRPSIEAWTGDRHKPLRKVFQTSGLSCRQFHLSQPRAYDRLQNLEDAANRDRDNANAQAIFLQV